MGNNNNQNGNRPSQRPSVVTGLTTTNIPLEMVSATFKTTSTALAQSISTLISDTLGITDVDFVSVYAIRNNKNEVEDFGCDLYFNTDKGGADRNVTRLGGGNNNNGRRFVNNGTKVNMMQFLNGKSSRGGFNVSEKFRKNLASVLIFDENGDVRISADPSDARIAIVEVDLWAIAALTLDISNDDNYNFILTPGKPLNNKDNCVDYELYLTKEVEAVNQKKRGRSGVNYERMAARRAQSRR